MNDQRWEPQAGDRVTLISPNSPPLVGMIGEIVAIHRHPSGNHYFITRIQDGGELPLLLHEIAPIVGQDSQP